MSLDRHAITRSSYQNATAVLIVLKRIHGLAGIAKTLATRRDIDKHRLILRLV